MKTIEKMVEDTRRHLTSDLLQSKYKQKPWPAGHCYVASEVIYHLLDCVPKPMFIRHEGEPHWFLIYNKQIIDATSDQFKTPVPYHLARGNGFLTKKPSSRAQIILNKIKGKR